MKKFLLLEKIQSVQGDIADEMSVTDETDTDNERYWKRVAYASIKLTWYAMAKVRGQMVSEEKIILLINEITRKEVKGEDMK